MKNKALYFYGTSIYPRTSKAACLREARKSVKFHNCPMCIYRTVDRGSGVFEVIAVVEPRVKPAAG